MKGGSRNKMGLVVITDMYIMLIIMLVDFHHFLLFWFSLFYTLKFLIHYFQFINFTHLFQSS